MVLSRRTWVCYTPLSLLTVLEALVIIYHNTLENASLHFHLSSTMDATQAPP